MQEEYDDLYAPRVLAEQGRRKDTLWEACEGACAENWVGDFGSFGYSTVVGDLTEHHNSSGCLDVTVLPFQYSLVDSSFVLARIIVVRFKCSICVYLGSKHILP